MEELWAAGESSVREVVALLKARGSNLAYTTVLTVMVRLHARGLLTRRREGRRDLYRAAVDPAGLSAALSREAVDRLIEAHGDDAVAAFAARMRDGDPADLARLRELLSREDL
jgi:predicted transcriptional regulator